MPDYYPLAAGNQWQYKQKDGTTYLNKVTAANGSDYQMHNSAVNSESTMRKSGERYQTDAMEKGNFQEWLGNDLKKGDSWEVKFRANGLDSVLVMTVMDSGITLGVEGRDFHNVIFIEAESRLLMNGNVMPLNFFTQYYYADGVGLVMTTSSAGDGHYLIDYQLN